MTGFLRQQGALVCDGVPLARIAAAEGTPLYVYSAATIAERYRAIDEAFGSYPHALHYALKANSTLAIARLLRGLGSGADANSGGEIDVALRAGFIPPQIVFTGVGKTAAELAQAIDLGVKTINAESDGELERIDVLARERQTRARVALRVNPDIDARSHPHISTGLKTNKFGIAMDDAREIGRRFARAEGVEIVGLHSHVGSQITDLDPLRRAARRSSRSRASCATTGSRSSTSTSAAASACRTTAPRCRPPATTRPRCCRSCANPAWRSCSSRAATSSRPPARCCRGSWT